MYIYTCIHTYIHTYILRHLATDPLCASLILMIPLFFSSHTELYAAINDARSVCGYFRTPAPRGQYVGVQAVCGPPLCDTSLAHGLRTLRATLLGLSPGSAAALMIY